MTSKSTGLQRLEHAEHAKEEEYVIASDVTDDDEGSAVLSRSKEINCSTFLWRVEA